MSDFRIYPAPASVPESNDFRVSLEEQAVFCYTARVYNSRNPEGVCQGLPFSTASFAYFDTAGPIEVEVTCLHPIEHIRVMPVSQHIDFQSSEQRIRFSIQPGQHISIEPYGDANAVLHVFANPMEEDIPGQDDNVIYYGPGIHEISSIQLQSNQTLYVAGGAVLVGVVAPDEPCYREEKKPNQITQRRYGHLIFAEDAVNVTIRGRGIIDSSLLENEGARKNPIVFTRCRNVKVEGVILKEATCWNLTMYRSEQCLVDGVKIISAFYNSDGINPVSSKQVVIRNCFVRQRDDGIAIKAMDTGNVDCFLVEPEGELPGGECKNIHVENCVIWSDWGFALGVTYETRKPISHVSFENCTIIHATHNTPDQGVLGILVSDESEVRDIYFNHITVERSLKPLIKLVVKKTPWTVSEQLGRIRDVYFQNIALIGGEKQPILIESFSPISNIENVSFEKIAVVGTPLEELDPSLCSISPYSHHIKIGGKEEGKYERL
ncbi:glycosyl hydrolase family 28 protein [Paenibacillus sp. strain BS8-2]